MGKQMKATPRNGTSWHKVMNERYQECPECLSEYISEFFCISLANFRTLSQFVKLCETAAVAQLVQVLRRVLRWVLHQVLRWPQPRPWRSELAALDSLARGTTWQWWQQWRWHNMCLPVIMCPCTVQYIWLKAKCAAKVPPGQCHAGQKRKVRRGMEPWISK